MERVDGTKGLQIAIKLISQSYLIKRKTKQQCETGKFEYLTTRITLG